jgi:hypothetical protein
LDTIEVIEAESLNTLGICLKMAEALEGYYFERDDGSRAKVNFHQMAAQVPEIMDDSLYSCGWSRNSLALTKVKDPPQSSKQPRRVPRIQLNLI